MDLRARIIEGTDIWYDQDLKNNKYYTFIKTNNEKVYIRANCDQEGFNALYNIGKLLWDLDMCSKFEIAAFDDAGKLFWKHRPDMYNFARNSYKNCFVKTIKEEYKSFTSPDFQNDKLETEHLRDYQKRFWSNRNIIYTPHRFEFTIKATRLKNTSSLDNKILEAKLSSSQEDLISNAPHKKDAFEH